MTIRRIDVDVEKNGDRPFLNKITNGFESLVGTNWFIHEVVLCDTGYLIITAEFKAFIFKDSQMFSFLKQALDVWTQQNDLSYPLFAEVLKTKKITLAVDDEAMTSSWITSGSRYLQTQNPLEHDSLTLERSNPLLPPTPIVSISRKRQPKSSTALTESIGH